MEENMRPTFGSEFTMTDPSKYVFVARTVAPDGQVHSVIFDKEKIRNAYIVRRKYAEDMSFYAPYILRKIGQKIGVKTPETELGLFEVVDKKVGEHAYTFEDASCVFIDNSSVFNSSSHSSYISPEVAYAIFGEQNPDIAEKHRESCDNVDEIRALPMTIDEYIDSTIFVLTSRGSKPQEQYTSSEISQMRQEVINRIVLGLKLGIDGDTSIITYRKSDARLSSYYLASNNMFGLNLRQSWITEEVSDSDEEFLKFMDREFPVQYGIPPNIEKPSANDLFKYLFDKYPQETEKAYKRVKAYTSKDLEKELNSYTVLDSTHKQLALRVFSMRDKQLGKVYNDYLRTKDLGNR